MDPGISRPENSSVPAFSFRNSLLKLGEINRVYTRFIVSKNILVFQLKCNGTRTNLV